MIMSQFFLIIIIMYVLLLLLLCTYYYVLIIIIITVLQNQNLNIKYQLNNGSNNQANSRVILSYALYPLIVSGVDLSLLSLCF
jgi:hypothetical protein